MRKKSFLAVMTAAALMVQTPIAVYADEGLEVVDLDAADEEDDGSKWVDSNSDPKQQTVDGDVSVSRDEISAVGTGSPEEGGDASDVSLTVQGDVVYSGENGNGVFAADNASTNVNGNVHVTGNGSPGAVADNGGKVAVDGNIVVTGDVSQTEGGEISADGVVAVNGGSIHVTGTVSSAHGSGVVADGASSSVKVEDNVASAGVGGKGAIATHGGEITIIGDVTSTGDYREFVNGADLADGVFAANGGNIHVTGNVSSENGVGAGAANEDGEDSSSVVITGNVNSQNSFGVRAEGTSSVKVEGDVSGHTGVTSYGTSSSVEVKGDVTAKGTGGMGAEAFNGGKVTIIGDVNATGDRRQYENNLVEFADGAFASSGGEIEIIGNVSSEDGFGAAAVDSSVVNITGNVDSKLLGIEAVENGMITVTGDVSGSSGARVATGGKADVSGNVTGKEYYGVSTDNSSYVKVSGDVTSANETALVIDLNAASGNGTVIVEGSVSSGGRDSSIYIDKAEDADISAESIINALPTIIVGELVSNEEDNYLWNYYDETLGDDNEKKGELNEQILKEKVYYIVKGNSMANGSWSGTGGKVIDGYLVAQEGEELTVTITADDGYEIASVSGGKATVTRNEDGTYSIIVPRGGGIDISAVLKAIAAVETARSESSGTSDEAKSVVSGAFLAYAETQQKVQEGLVRIPQNGTYDIEMKDIISFNRKSFEEFASRPDVVINITYTYKGHRYLVVIPAGYPVLDLLDENGYCGCLYLNAVFGSQLID